MSSYKRSVVKSLVWRAVSTTDTLVIGWLITGSMKTGIMLSVAETISGFVLYFIHERVWDRISFGIK